MPVQWTSRARLVAQWFEISPADLRRSNRKARDASPRIPITPNHILLLTGPSGAGKSTLLCHLRRRFTPPDAWIDLDEIHLPNRRVVDVMAQALSVPDDEPGVVVALEALSRVGLGEVWTYLRTPAQLSEGQRWRLRLAIGVARCQRLLQQPGVTTKSGLERGSTFQCRGQAILAADEFAARLDPITGAIVARALRRAVDQTQGLSAIVATSREEAPAWLRPDTIITCDFGQTSVALQSRA